MKKRIFILLLALIALSVSACAVDPRKDAAGYAARIEADQSALNQTQARRILNEDHAVELSHEIATVQEWSAAENKVVHVGAIALQIILWMIAVPGGIALAIALIGTGTAWVRYVHVRANLVPLDRVTRQYPQLITYVGRGRYAISNLNVDSTRLLDTRQDADRQMILGMSNVQYAGALGHEARLSLQSGQMAAMPAPFTEALNESVSE